MSYAAARLRCSTANAAVHGSRSTIWKDELRKGRETALSVRTWAHGLGAIVANLVEPVEESSVNQDTCGQCREIGCCGCAGNLEGLKHCLHAVVHGQFHSCDNSKGSHPSWNEQISVVIPFSSSENKVGKEAKSSCERLAPNELVPRRCAQDVGHVVVVMSQGSQSSTRHAERRQTGRFITQATVP